MYQIQILAFFCVLPIASIAIEWSVRGRRSQPRSLLALAGVWFTFWAVGGRLFTAGLSQAFNPGYTAQSIFGIGDPVVLPFVQELGFANIAMGVVALASVYFRSWTIPVAAVGGLYYGFAGIRHLLKGGEFTDLRMIAMISDLAILVILGVCVVLTTVRVARGSRPRS